MRNRVGLLTTSATASINVNKFLPRSMATISKNATSKKDFVGAPWLQQRQLVSALNQFHSSANLLKDDDNNKGNSGDGFVLLDGIILEECSLLNCHQSLLEEDCQNVQNVEGL
uniref:Uncharacterized protein n=1 Tax=Meloidogyne enterolobii TaxID=390850 RepID=A0A6V7W3K3_MELEN|nr:unnamed protein product [Meloidogyne enterolobii]